MAEKISQDLGCTVAFISNIENNRAKLTLRVLLYYAVLCNVSVDTFLNAGRSDLRDTSDTVLYQELQTIF